ncbi:tetrapyrrole biosynthesis, uroporphyrinogen III synthase [Mycena sp. CBHHK59/15]|nr:tetrapyrrole biosynthesis, uroporphyrinogen III synthase [Mycena sp. CBHHK59/15]
MINVLLLRAPSQNPDSPDRYDSMFRDSGYRASSVPVLETVLTNLETLTDIVRSGSRHAGVIITSGRACEAWSKACETLENQSSQEVPSQESDWSSTPFYVVGKNTASMLTAIRLAHPQSRFVPRDTRGESSGTSEQLARFILADLESSPESAQLPLLYLTGDKNRDTLPDILRRGGLELSPLQVYQTQGSESFPRDLKLAIESSPHLESNTWWIVFFAPSAAEFVTPFLRHHFDLRSTDGSVSSTTQSPARIASIGPTTSTYLQDQLNLQVDAVAIRPTAEDLVQAVLGCDQSRGWR